MTRRRILYVQYTNPGGYPPLEHQSRILADDGWDVLFVGTGAHGAGDLTFPPHPRVTVRRMSFCRPGWQQKLHYIAYLAWALATVATWRPAVVYCSDAFATPVGLLAHWLFRAWVVYHEHDTPSPPTNSIHRAISAARARLVAAAVACVVPNPERAARFETALHPRRLFCVWNCPTVAEVLPARSRPPAPGHLRLWYHGSLSPSQFPVAVVQALALLPDGVSLEFAGYETVGHPGYVAELLEVATKTGVGDRVRYVGTPPTRSELYALAANSHIGLALFARAFREPMAGASNKPFDYLACGLALVVTDTPEWVDFHEPAGCALSCDPADHVAISAAVRLYLADLAETLAMGEAGRRRILAEWNYETQFGPVKRFLEELASSRQGRSSLRHSTDVSCASHPHQI